VSEANVNNPFSAVATEAEVQAARRRPLKIVDESAAMIGLLRSLCVFTVRKDSGHLNQVRAVGRDTCSAVRVDRDRARRCREEPGLAHCRTRISRRLPTGLEAR
jgi:hypothetical protein